MPYDVKTTSAPLFLEEFTKLMDTFLFLKTESLIAIAVSGGPDSLALTLLLHQWACQNQKNIPALTVDHGLRLGSAKEALHVQSWMQQHSIPHKILTWQGPKPTARIQETARRMRYSLLQQACWDQDITTLMTAHHAYDQVETFLMRLGKKKGGEKPKIIVCSGDDSKNLPK